MAADKYFAYDSDSGFETYATMEEAKEAAESLLKAYSDYSDDGWDEEVNSVCWGEIKQQSSLGPTGCFIEFQGEMVESYDANLYDVE